MLDGIADFQRTGMTLRGDHDCCGCGRADEDMSLLHLRDSPYTSPHFLWAPGIECERFSARISPALLWGKTMTLWCNSRAGARVQRVRRRFIGDFALPLVARRRTIVTARASPRITLRSPQDLSVRAQLCVTAATAAATVTTPPSSGDVCGTFTSRQSRLPIKAQRRRGQLDVVDGAYVRRKSGDI